MTDAVTATRRHELSVEVNGEACVLSTAANRTLLQILREDLGLPGTKNGCSQGVCGTCTVLVDAVPVRACMTLALRCEGRKVTTVEGLAGARALHPLQQAFIDEGAVQCGFCTPGLLVSALALLRENPSPGEREVREALIGNLCRCTGYSRIVRAVTAAARSMRAAGETP